MRLRRICESHQQPIEDPMTDDRMALELSLRAFWLCFFRQHGICSNWWRVRKDPM